MKALATIGTTSCAALLAMATAAAALDGAATTSPERDTPPSTLASAPSGAAPVTLHRALVRTEALRAGLPPEVADAVTEVESGYNPASVGAAGEVGLMQVMPPTARMLGFTGSNAELATPEINIHYGVTYLARAWRLAGGDICTATMKYRAGHGETRFSNRSVDYCVRVRAKLAARGFPVTGTVPVATFGESSWPGVSRGRPKQASGRSLDLAGLNDKLRAISALASAQAKAVVVVSR